MKRFLLSLIIAALLGVAIGLYLGWVQFPARAANSPPTSLEVRYRDDYTLMIASAYRTDGDLMGALERLRFLEVENIPAYVQDVTERYITSSRDLESIRTLVALAEGLGRLTPIMEPYRAVSLPGDGS